MELEALQTQWQVLRLMYSSERFITRATGRQVQNQNPLFPAPLPVRLQLISERQGGQMEKWAGEHQPKRSGCRSWDGRGDFQAE